MMMKRRVRQSMFLFYLVADANKETRQPELFFFFFSFTIV